MAVFRGGLCGWGGLGVSNYTEGQEGSTHIKNHIKCELPRKTHHHASRVPNHDHHHHHHRQALQKLKGRNVQLPAARPSRHVSQAGDPPLVGRARTRAEHKVPSLMLRSDRSARVSRISASLGTSQTTRWPRGLKVRGTLVRQSTGTLSTKGTGG
jgi:hypothetical protein